MPKIHVRMTDEDLLFAPGPGRGPEVNSYLTICPIARAISRALAQAGSPWRLSSAGVSRGNVSLAYRSTGRLAYPPLPAFVSAWMRQYDQYARPWWRVTQPFDPTHDRAFAPDLLAPFDLEVPA